MQNEREKFGITCAASRQPAKPRFDEVVMERQ